MTNLVERMVISMSNDSRAGSRRGEKGWPDYQADQVLRRLALTAVTVVVHEHVDWPRRSLQEVLVRALPEIIRVGLDRQAKEPGSNLPAIAFKWDRVPEIEKVKFIEWVAAAVAEMAPVKST